MSNPQTEARAISRCVRGCATDDQYSELVERIATALEAQTAELAVVHQRYVDADEARIDAEAQLAEARKALEASASALEEAREDVEHWGSYAGEYFQDKHDLEGDLDRIAKQASAARRALTGGQEDG